MNEILYLEAQLTGHLPHQVDLDGGGVLLVVDGEQRIIRVAHGLKYLNRRMQQLLLPIMRTQRHHGNIDFEVVDFIDHAVLLVDAARPSLFEHKTLQVFHLPCSCSRMLLKRACWQSF